MGSLTDSQVFALACLAVVMTVCGLGMASHLREQIKAALPRRSSREG